jgi:uncharacterized membrane protein
VALLARAAVNEPLLSAAGLRGGQNAVRVSRATEIDAPADVVFDYVTDWQRWPEWMPNVIRVTRSVWGRDGQADVVVDLQPDVQLQIGERSHWDVEDPAGASISWDAVMTRFVENESVSWRSGEGAALQHAGTLRVVPRGGEATRLQIDLSCNPSAGRVGNLVAAFFGRDPKRQTQIALERLKSVIETGAARDDATARVSRARTALRSLRAGLR